MPDASRPLELTPEQRLFDSGLDYAAERKRLLTLAAGDLRRAEWMELANDQGFALVATAPGMTRDRVLARITPQDSRPTLLGDAPVRNWRCELFGFRGSSRPAFVKAKVLASCTRRDSGEAKRWLAEQIWITWADIVWRSLNGRPTAFAELATIGQPLHRRPAAPPAD